ncbi:hypothetical protein D3C81_974870 [compost metagenome]
MVQSATHVLPENGDMRRLIVTSWLRYEPSVVVNVSKMKPVGPSTSTAANNNAASARLKLDNHLMPRSTPLMVDSMYSTNATVITVNCSGTPLLRPNTRCRPAAIWMVPKPSVVATPIAVATTAAMFTIWPNQPRWWRPITGCSMSLINPRPLRLYWNQAIARPISA